MGLEVAARGLGEAAAGGRGLEVGESDGSGGRLSVVEREEGRRRGAAMWWWGVRGAAYENLTGGVVRGVGGWFGEGAIGGLVGGVLGDWDALWGEYYFPTATL